MKGLKQFGKELAAIARNKKVLIPIVGVITIPVMYAAMFLGAFWDPYERLAELPVAVVNMDEGVDMNGEHVNVGEKFVEKLKGNTQFNWRFVDKEEAEKGFENKTYYMALEIPADFSESTMSLTSDNPSPAQMIYKPNEGYNFLASQIGSTAVNQMNAALNKEVTETYMKTVLEQADELVSGLGAASDGAGQLADGTAAAKDGAAFIQRNLSKLANGSLALQQGAAKLSAGGAELAAGSGELAGGAAELASGLSQLSEAQQQLGAGADALGSGAAELGAGASQLGAGLQQLGSASAQLAASAGGAQQSSGQLADGLAASAAGASHLQAGAGELAQGLEKLAQANAALAQDPGFQRLLASSKQLNEGLSASAAAQSELSSGAAKLHNGLTQISGGLASFDEKLQTAAASGEKLKAGGEQVSAGAMNFTGGMEQFGEKLAEASVGGAKLAEGAAKLDSGAAAFAGGLSELAGKLGEFADGSAQLENGAGELNAGLLKLDSGSHELSEKLSEAAGKTADVTVTDDQIDMFAAPIAVDVEKVNEVPNYGTGFAPYFLSLGLYVGALLITIVYSVKEPVNRPANGWSWFWSKALTLTVVGIAQALLADTALLWILDLQVQSVPLFIAYSIITSMTFMMLIQFLVAVMGNPGRFIAIVILIFQLTSSAGTFPLELIPSWLQKVTPWMPMTYSVAGFKDVVSNGDYTSMWSNAGMLAVFAGASALLTLIYFSFIHRNTMKEPEQGELQAI